MQDFVTHRTCKTRQTERLFMWLPQGQVVKSHGEMLRNIWKSTKSGGLEKKYYPAIHSNQFTF